MEEHFRPAPPHLHEANLDVWIGNAGTRIRMPQGHGFSDATVIAAIRARRGSATAFLSLEDLQKQSGGLS